MNDNFKEAVEFAISELGGVYERGGSFSALNQKGRYEQLGVFFDDFDWQSRLQQAAGDFNSFDSLKRYCAHLIRAKKQIPDDLKYWIADVLEGVQPTPKQPRGGVSSGLENNFLIPRLVEKVGVLYKLTRTRNDTSDHRSACDAVHQAIIQIPEALDIKSRQYRTIKKAYLDAKKRGIFVGN